ncbi:hypothetical protein [Natronococcus occultus]|uniref:Universal stress family protein n=1 Tax=Natronococcus occultus SP4 TaxID=694430 RepID=L0K307_9EURY|nr:hypothetical protein [Natronococcus occultus]AGB38930.1 hypothetical protein Natoc_3191 [Natronococcus occultus SP4]
MHRLVGTDSVHATAAICDYLEDELVDDVTIVAPVEPGDETARRDGQEALNVASVRLVGADVETELREDGSGSVLCEVAATIEPDEVIVGSSDVLEPERRALLEAERWPVVVVPVPDLE